MPDFIQPSAVTYKPLSAGVGRRDITPPQTWIDAGRVWLWGMGDGYRNTPCYARSLAGSIQHWRS